MVIFTFIVTSRLKLDFKTFCYLDFYINLQNIFYFYIRNTYSLDSVHGIIPENIFYVRHSRQK